MGPSPASGFLILALSLGLATPPLAAQGAPAARPPACQSSEHRQFDFWIGEWDVTLPNGKHAGTNTIRPILGGCVLQENWTGAGGLTGTSYNIYDQAGGRWHQTWVDSQGSLLELNGVFQDGKMVLAGEQKDSSGTSLQRITWTPTGSDQVRQLWEASNDGGKTWTVQFDGRYKRKAA